MTLSAAAQRIGVSRQAAHQMVTAGRLIVTRRNGAWRGAVAGETLLISRDSVERVRAERIETLRQQLQKSSGE